jgi:hypothetical protein
LLGDSLTFWLIMIPAAQASAQVHVIDLVVTKITFIAESYVIRRNHN